MSEPFVIETNPNPKDTAFLGERIYEYNVARTQLADGKLLAIFMRDTQGQIIAGLDGWTWGGCLWVEHLWVHEQHRAHGYGTRLLRAAESEASARGCQRAFLSTHSFQAPQFYQRFGYTVAGAFEDYPKGHGMFFMHKTLVA